MILPHFVDNLILKSRYYLPLYPLGGGIKSLVMQTERNRGEDTEDNLSLVPAPNRRKVYWNEAVIAYYTSPATKFTLHFVSYFYYHYMFSVFSR